MQILHSKSIAKLFLNEVLYESDIEDNFSIKIAPPKTIKRLKIKYNYLDYYRLIE